MNPIVNVENVKIEIDIEESCKDCCPCLPPITKQKYPKEKESDKKIQDVSKDKITNPKNI